MFFYRQGSFYKKLRIENKSSVLILLSQTLEWESLGELEKAAETFTCQLVSPQHFPFSQTSTCLLYLTIRLWAQDFYRMIADEGAVRVNYHAIEIESK